jgi:DNA primase
MPMIPRDIVDAIRDRTDIVEVVRRQVKLERRGQSWVGLCPFHQEKTPSFNVIPGKGIYHCFGCQEGGDVFRFVMRTENLSFFAAVQQLAGPAGIHIETRELSDEERRRLRARASLYDLMEEAAQFYESQLWTGPEGATARAYLERRRIGEPFAQKSRLGWAPAGWTRLVDHLHRKGFHPDLVHQGGLSRTRERGDGAYDTFRERLIVPIRDERGRVIAFGGRLLEGDGPKYINSPETDLYKKSEVLYGLDQAMNAIRARKRILLVEGYFDVLSLQQAGFGEAVATCGTALSDQHADRLSKLANDITFLTDSDRAGDQAAERIEEKYIRMFNDRGVSAWRLTLPDAKDPDEIIRERGVDAMEAALGARRSLLYWYAQRQATQFGYSNEGKRQILDRSAGLLAHLPPIARAEFAGYLRIPEVAVHDAAEGAARAERAQRAEGGPPEVERASEAAPVDTWRPTKEHTHLLWLLVHRYEQVADLLERSDARLLSDQPQLLPIVSRLLQHEPVVRILDELPEGTLRRTLVAVSARPALYAPDEAANGMLDQLVSLLRPRHDRWSEETQQAGFQALKEGRSADGRAAIAAVQEAKRLRDTMEQATRRQDVETAVSTIRALVDRLEGPSSA